MSKIFTKADIEIEHFEEPVSYLPYSDNRHVSKLYEYLEELKSQDIYVVDVALVSTHAKNSSLSEVFNQYMIRIVRPKYEVELFVGQFNRYGYEFDYHKSETIGVFKTADEAEALKKEYLAKNSHDGKYAVNVIRHSALELQF